MENGENQNLHIIESTMEKEVERDPLSRGVFSSQGDCLLQSPTNEQVKGIDSHNCEGRVTYFRFKQPINGEKTIVNAEGGLDLEMGIVGWKEFDGDVFVVDKNYGGPDLGKDLFINVMVVPALEKQIRKDFADKEVVGIRGVAASVDFDGVVEFGGMRIKNVEEIVTGGSESDDMPLYTVLIPKGNSEQSKIGHRSVQWLVDHARNLREVANKEGHPEMAELIFPVLLVYDIEALRNENFVTDPTVRSGAILRAYLLDYPNKNNL